MNKWLDTFSVDRPPLSGSLRLRLRYFYRLFMNQNSKGMFPSNFGMQRLQMGNCVFILKSKHLVFQFTFNDIPLRDEYVFISILWFVILSMRARRRKLKFTRRRINHQHFRLNQYHEAAEVTSTISLSRPSPSPFFLSDESVYRMESRRNEKKEFHRRRRHWRRWQSYFISN